jgi:hypothetical protein
MTQSKQSQAQESYQTPDVPAEILELIERAHWQSARTVEHVAPHQYNVLGWDKDDLTDEEFWKLAKVIKQMGRVEVWTAPEGFYDSGKRPKYRNNYLYVGEYAYWFTYPRSSKPMLNREHVSVQNDSPNPTRVPL